MSYLKREPSAVLFAAQLAAVLLYPFMEDSGGGARAVLRLRHPHPRPRRACGALDAGSDMGGAAARRAGHRPAAADGRRSPPRTSSTSTATACPTASSPAPARARTSRRTRGGSRRVSVLGWGRRHPVARRRLGGRAPGSRRPRRRRRRRDLRLQRGGGCGRSAFAGPRGQRSGGAPCLRRRPGIPTSQPD